MNCKDKTCKLPNNDGNSVVAKTFMDEKESLNAMGLAMRTLAGQCDFASKKDDIGFNKPDAFLGHLLASIPEKDWSDTQKQVVYDMLTFYQRQLSGNGIDVNKILPPKSVTIFDRSSSVNAIVDVEGSNYKIEYRYNEYYNDSLKKRGGRYSGKKYWLVPITESNKVWMEEFSKDNEWYVSDNARNFTITPIVPASTPLTNSEPSRSFIIEKHIGTFKFTYQEDIKNAIKAIEGRSWGGQNNPVWSVVISKNNYADILSVINQFSFQVIGTFPNLDENPLLSIRKVTISQDNKTLLFSMNKADEDCRSFIKSSPVHPYWDPGDLVWRLPINPSNLLYLAESLDTVQLNLSDDLKNFIINESAKFKKNFEDSIDFKGTTNEIGIIDGLKQQPSPDQMIAVQYATRVKKIINGDDKGYGKTFETIAAIQYNGLYPCLIVCPKNVKYNWPAEFDKWTENKRVKVIKDKSDTSGLENYDVIIVNYDILSEIEPSLKNIKLRVAVGDEAHYLKSPLSKRSQAFNNISRNIENIYLLTGSVIKNRAKEALSLINILGWTNLFGGERKFLNNFCWDDDNGNYEGFRNEEVLYRMLREICMIRRKKEDAIGLKPVETFNIETPLTNKKEYNFAENNFYEWLSAEIENDPFFRNAIQSYTKEEQRKFLNEYKTQIINSALRAKALSQLTRLRKLAGLGKVDSAVSYVSDFLESEDKSEKLIVFAIHQDVVKDIKEGLLKVKGIPEIRVIDQHTHAQKRFEYAKEFVEDSDKRIIIVTKAGGEGINLYSASNILAVEQDWSPETMDQVSSRANRRGQKNTVNMFNLIDSSTVDNIVMGTLNRKNIGISAVLDNNPKEYSNTEITIDDFLNEYVNRIVQDKLKN